MDKEQALSLVRQYKQTISGMFDTSKVYMFGSYSKGYATHEMIKNLDLSKIRVKRQSVLNELEEALDVKW